MGSKVEGSVPSRVYQSNRRDYKPLVTVGMCVRNCEELVGEAVHSIFVQVYPHELMEVVVVDDGSEDKTLSVMLDAFSSMNKGDTQIKVFHSEWRGLGAARNTVVDNALGSYIIWVDGDMTLPKDHIQRQVMFMEENIDVGVAKAKYAMLEEKSIVAYLENIKFIIEDEVAPKLPGTGGSIYRVSAIRQVGGFDDSLTGTGEDEDAAFRIQLAGWQIRRTSAVFFEKRSKVWRELWEKYFWYGYGDYQLYRKNRKIFSLIKMNPVVGIVLGLFYLVMAYRLTHSKFVLLFPFHFGFKLTAWCVGFTKSKCDTK